MFLEFLVGPTVGGVIGYITNNIAIKMLFKPVKPVYVFGRRLPFTPGMIPKEQARIAKAVGEVVGKELVNEETLKQHLLSPDMVSKLEVIINDWVIKQKQSTHTVGEALEALLGDKTIELLTVHLEDGLSKLAYKKLTEMNLGEPLAKQAIAAIQGQLGPMASFLAGGLMENAEGKLQGIINKLIEEQGEETVKNVIITEKQNLFNMPVATFINNLEEELPRVRYILINQYVSLIQNQLENMIQTINIAEIVEDKIKNYDVEEMEAVILSIVDRELNAIVWLGAFLGAVMGLIMNFF